MFSLKLHTSPQFIVKKNFLIEMHVIPWDLVE